MGFLEKLFEMYSMGLNPPIIMEEAPKISAKGFLLAFGSNGETLGIFPKKLSNAKKNAGGLDLFGGTLEMDGLIQEIKALYAVYVSGVEIPEIRWQEVEHKIIQEFCREIREETQLPLNILKKAFLVPTKLIYDPSMGSRGRYIMMFTVVFPMLWDTLERLIKTGSHSTDEHETKPFVADITGESPELNGLIDLMVKGSPLDPEDSPDRLRSSLLFEGAMLVFLTDLKRFWKENNILELFKLKGFAEPTITRIIKMILRSLDITIRENYKLQFYQIADLLYEEKSEKKGETRMKIW